MKTRTAGPSRPSARGRATAWTMAIALGFGACSEPAPPVDPGELLTIRTVGLALLEENRLDDAEIEFLRLIELAPDEPLGSANLGLTYLRMGRLEDAADRLRRAIELEPGDADVRLILGEVLREQNDPDGARALLQESLTFDPAHVKTLYALVTLGADDLSPGAAAERSGLLEQVVDLRPGNVAARVAWVEALLRSDEAEEAAIQLEEIRRIVPTFPVQGQELFDEALAAARIGDAEAALPAAIGFHNVMRTVPVYQQGLIEVRGPGGVLVGFPVVTFSETFGAATRDAETVLAALRFTDATDALGLPRQGAADASAPVALAVADFDGDRDRDVLIAGKLWRNEITGFVDVTVESGLPAGTSRTASFGDYDNDGALDLYLGGASGGQVFQSSGQGGFTERTAALGPGVPAGEPLWMDFDQDGDLDLVIASPSGPRLLQNDLDGTFTDVTTRSGVSQGGLGDVVFGDLDDDDDLDLLMPGPNGVGRLYENGRAGAFQDASDLRGYAADGATISAVGDFDNDGWLDLLTADRGRPGLILHRNDGTGSFSADTRPTELLSGAEGLRIHDAVFVDFDNDGWLDVLLVGEDEQGAGAARLYRNADAGRFDDLSAILPTDLPALRRVATADFGDDGDLDLFVATADGGVRFLRNDGGNGNRYLKMQLVGLSTGSGKNNYFGIGAKLEVRAGGLYQTRVVTGPEIHVGLGQYSRADVVRVRWTNGVPQNLFYPDANQSVVEEQILKGSCPFLYTWDGERFTFVTDLMWKSALGMPMGLMARGDTEYAPADASQGWVRIPQEALVERDGAYELRVTGELWEVFYIDEVDLVAVDHPASVDVFVDERFTFPQPGQTLELHSVATPRPLRSAVDGQGRDWTERLASADDRYVDDLSPERHQGLSAMHDLVLDLGDFDSEDAVTLFMRGWIFPTDASINVAVSQSDALETVMPYLQVPDANGDWVTVVPALSFPAGKNKLVIQDLTGMFPTDDHRVRIRTNVDIFWDHAYWTAGESPAPTRVTTLQPMDADFRYRGFSETSRKGGRFGPHWFDYETVHEESPWRPIQGRFTRYGDVLPLVRESDDRYPIMGPGDELALRYASAELPELPDGWSRTFLIYSDGWVKDADLNTADGWRVEPLPFHGMSQYPYGPEERYPLPGVAAEFHTRSPTTMPDLRPSDPGGR